MAYRRGPTLKMHFWTVGLSFALIFGAVWVRAAYPKLSFDIWVGFWGMVDGALQALYWAANDDFAIKIQSIIFVAVVLFFGFGFLLMIYEELIKTP